MENIIDIKGIITKENNEEISEQEYNELIDSLLILIDAKKCSFAGGFALTNEEKQAESKQLNMHDVSNSFFCTKTQNNEPKCKTECNFCKDMQKEYEEQKNDY